MAAVHRHRYSDRPGGERVRLTCRLEIRGEPTCVRWDEEHGFDGPPDLVMRLQDVDTAAAALTEVWRSLGEPTETHIETVSSVN